MKFAPVFIIATVALISLAFVPATVSAWTDPGSGPPNPQPISFPPINTSLTGQDKAGPSVINSPSVLTIGTLQVFGNALVRATDYINWGTTQGQTGYGFRALAGVMQYKNSGGSWTNVAPVSGAPTSFQQYGFTNYNNNDLSWCDIPSLTNVICEVYNVGVPAGWTQEQTGTTGGYMIYKEIPGQGTTPWTECAMNGYFTPFDWHTRGFVVKKPNNKWYVYIHSIGQLNQHSVLAACWR